MNAFDRGVPSTALDGFLHAAKRAGAQGLEESEFRGLAASVTSSVVQADSLPEVSALERIADLCGEANADTPVRDEVHRLAGRLLADLPADIQSRFVSLCLQRLTQDLLGDQNTRSWRPIAYVLAANYSLIKSRDLRRQLIDKLRLLTKENPAYKNDFFIEDLLLIHERMRLGDLDEIKEMLEARHAGGKQS
jgi:hypothetical protein